MTARSVMGVKAPAGKPGSELLGGVVLGLFVVRSVLTKQVALSVTIWSDRAFKRSEQRSARAIAGARTSATRAARQDPRRDMRVLREGARQGELLHDAKGRV